MAVLAMLKYPEISSSTDIQEKRVSRLMRAFQFILRFEDLNVHNGAPLIN